MKFKTTDTAIGLILGLIIGIPFGFFLHPAYPPAILTLKTAGSTTIFPLSFKWATEYHSANPRIQIQVAAGGSGQGQSSSVLGIVDFGASSSYPSYTYRIENPSVLIIPIAADAIAVIANNGVNESGMQMTRNQVISIFNGSVTTWEAFETIWGTSIDATGIIEVYVRSEASGTTATFGKWLGTGIGWTLGYKESISWPGQPNFHAVEGNDAVRAGVASASGAIGYVGLAYTTGVIAIDLHNDGNGEYVTPSVDAAKLAIPITMTNASDSLFDSVISGAYPIVRLLFYLVNTNPLVYTWGGVRQSTIDFLNWALTVGQNPDWIQTDVGYLEITGTGALTLAENLVNSISPVPGLAPRCQPLAMFNLRPRFILIV